jgi:predicted nucleic-acid-binding Zn-ribbon protein
MREGLCPKCGSKHVRRRENAWYLSGGEKTGIKMLHENYAEYTAVPTVYLCTDCGYFESYIEDAKALGLARRYWTGHDDGT